ncbi:hypothetical protein PAPYR_10023 [Paratrimastix pyriformis]|uniref:Uncharacterized protein n=1 Tax=Paratrimastix pyriformis TaxID=342808 RepID=A0ABQ8UBV9_9EUKA|nr:hypothetical protein PAPYR_10023 [Paratrimastix pyriformis]
MRSHLPFTRAQHQGQDDLLCWKDLEWDDDASECLLSDGPFAVRLRLQDASSVPRHICQILQESLLLGDTLFGPGLRMVTNLAGTHPESTQAAPPMRAIPAAAPSVAQAMNGKVYFVCRAATGL